MKEAVCSSFLSLFVLQLNLQKKLIVKKVEILCSLPRQLRHRGICRNYIYIKTVSCFHFLPLITGFYVSFYLFQLPRIFVCMCHFVCVTPTLGAVLADICPLCITWVWTGLAALIEWHAHVPGGDRGEPRRQSLLTLLCLRAVHPVQLAWAADITQAQPHTSLPTMGTENCLCHLKCTQKHTLTLTIIFFVDALVNVDTIQKLKKHHSNLTKHQVVRQSGSQQRHIKVCELYVSLPSALIESQWDVKKGVSDISYATVIMTDKLDFHSMIPLMDCLFDPLYNFFFLPTGKRSSSLQKNKSKCVTHCDVVRLFLHWQCAYICKSDRG